MPIVASDLIYPVGEIRVEWFPGEDVPGNLTQWLADGAEEAPGSATTEQVDSLSRAFAYWRAYDAKTMLMAGTPDTAALSGEMSATITQGRKYFQGKAAEWRAVFDALLSVAATVGASTSPPRASSTVPFAVVF